MRKAGRSAPDVVAAIRDAWSIAVRAGAKPHRFIRIWAVVVEGRVFVRSWSLSPRGWYRTLLVEGQGVVRVGGRELPFRAAPARGTPLTAAVDRGYLKKYTRPGEARYARDLCGPRSRATTTELVLTPPLPVRSLPSPGPGSGAGGSTVPRSRRTPRSR